MRKAIRQKIRSVAANNKGGSNNDPIPPPRLVLLPIKRSPDAIRMIGDLLDKAKSGRIVGIVYGALYARRGRQNSPRFVVGYGGEISNDPTYARGMLAKLDDILAKEVKFVLRKAKRSGDDGDDDC